MSQWFPIVPLVPHCPYGSLLSLWFPIVLDPFCPGLSWIHLVLDPCCPVLLGPRGRPWQRNIGQGHGQWNGIGKEPHFQPTGQKTTKRKIGPKFEKKSKIEDFGSRLVQIDFRLGRSQWNFIFRRQGRIKIPKYSIFYRFWRNPFFWKNMLFFPI